MARIKNIATANSTGFQNTPEITPDKFVSLLETIVNTYAVKGRKDFYWLGNISNKIFESGTFFALQAELKGFDGSENLITSCRTAEAICNHYGIDFAPDLAFTKDNFFKKNGLSEKGAMVARIQKYPNDYGAENIHTIQQAIKFVQTIDMRSKFGKQLKADAVEIANIRKDKLLAIWERVEQISDIEYPDANIGDLNDIPPQQIYNIFNQIVRTFDSVHENLMGKASLAGLDDNENDEKFFMDSATSAKVVADYARTEIALADQVHNSNTSEEISRDVPTSDNLADNATHQYEVDNNLPH